MEHGPNVSMAVLLGVVLVSNGCAGRGQHLPVAAFQPELDRPNQTQAVGVAHSSKSRRIEVAEAMQGQEVAGLAKVEARVHKVRSGEGEVINRGQVPLRLDGCDSVAAHPERVLSPSSSRSTSWQQQLR
jgi:hypothetical protein